jgi:hypothetical protein
MVEEFCGPEAHPARTTANPEIKARFIFIDGCRPGFNHIPAQPQPKRKEHARMRQK